MVGKSVAVTGGDGFSNLTVTRVRARVHNGVIVKPVTTRHQWPELALAGEARHAR